MSHSPGRDVELRRFTTRSASMSIPTDSSYERDEAFISHTGPLRSTPGKVSRFGAVVPLEMGRREWPESDHGGGGNVHLTRSGPLGLCDNPDCTTCPGKHMHYRESKRRDRKLHNILYGDTEGWTRKLFPSLSSYFPIMNPHTKFVQQWNKFFVISCLVAIFIDPLFFFLLSVVERNKCIVLNWALTISIAAVRSVTDFIYLLHMLLQFRLAYVAPESRVVGTGDLVDQPKKIALNYIRGYFILDLFVVLPLPQIMVLVVIPAYLGSSAANYAKNLLRATVLLQYIPRIVRFLPFLGGQSASGFIFESAWANFVINLLMFVLAGHVVGSCWYLFGLQRVNQCLRDACSDSHISRCKDFLDCGRGNNVDRYNGTPGWQDWKDNSNATQCFLGSGGNFNYGIYQYAVLLTTQNSVITRYIYSLFWGFQQISTLAGNLVPSYFEGEVLFTMAIVGLGLLLFALLIGNMQNFLQALGRRRLEMQLRRRDVEQWMSHRRLPEELRRKVRNAERFSWAATRGVNEEELLENLPEDLQREIRRHFFKFLKKVRIFTLMDEPILDAICERLRQKLYIRGSDISYQGGPVEKMVFIVRGGVQSIGADGNIAPLSEGDVCGEELLMWYLEHSTNLRDGGKIQGRLFSTRTVKCLTNVEAFALTGADLEEVTALFSRFLRNPRVQGAIRSDPGTSNNLVGKDPPVMAAPMGCVVPLMSRASGAWVEHLIGLTALLEMREDVAGGFGSSGSVAPMILWPTFAGHSTEHIAPHLVSQLCMPSRWCVLMTWAREPGWFRTRLFQSSWDAGTKAGVVQSSSGGSSGRSQLEVENVPSSFSATSVVGDVTQSMDSMECSLCYNIAGKMTEM